VTKKLCTPETFRRRRRQTIKSVILRDDVRSRLKEIGQADIIIGIPSFNNHDTIAHVVRAVQAGVTKYFQDMTAVLVNSDGGSTDGTQEIVEQTMIEDFQPLLIPRRRDLFSKITTPYHGLPGKGSAFRTVFEIARQLQAKACAVVDSDLRSITPEWIDLLVRPVLEGGFDFVNPYYLRHKFDGTITNSIVYPLTRCLYGKQIRQPIGGDFGFSGRLAEFFLSKDVWDTDVARFGIDIWMTTTAVANNFKVCQSFLGAKIHAAKDPGADLSAMLTQVVSSVFQLMEEYEDLWKGINESSPVPIFGFQFAVGLEPINVNTDRMIHMFHAGIIDLAEILQNILDPETMNDIGETLIYDPFRMSDELWARIIYDYAIAWHRHTMNRDHIMKTLTPLYLGKVASLVMELMDSNANEVEVRLESLCNAFQRTKRYLITKWELAR
jgi:glycosyltransferase involved in cell wall biosynthesis